MRISNNIDRNLIPFTKEAFPNFTIEMWRGNAPCGIGHTYIRQNGELVNSDRWQTRFGGGQSIDNEIKFAEFSLNQKVSIFIVGKTIVVNDIRYAGKTDLWQYSNDQGYVAQGVRYELQKERLRDYLSAKVEDCKLWLMVQRKAKELTRNDIDW